MAVRWALAACLLLAVPALAHNGETHEPTPTTLYVHIDGYQDAPINTQAPGAGFAQDASVGTGTNTVTCLPEATGSSAFSTNYQTVYGFAAVGPIDYSQSPAHYTQARGLGQDLAIEPDGLVLHWFLSTRAAAGAEVAPVAIPNVVVKATLREGSAISIHDEAYNAGRLLAAGASPPATLAKQGTSGATWTQVDGRDVYEFVVPLATDGGGDAFVAKEQGFNLRVDTFLDSPVCPGAPEGGYLMPNLVAVHTSPEHRPRLELSAVNPLVDRTETAQLNGGTVLRFYVTDAFGLADIANHTFTIEGPGKAATVLGPLTFPSRFDEFSPMDPTGYAWFWNSTADHAKAGDYTAILNVTTLQGESHEARVHFTVGSGKSSPMPMMPLLALALLVAVAVRRRARNA